MLRALVIGLGQIGMGYDLHDDSNSRRVATLTRAFAEHDCFSLVGGVDLCPIRRQLFISHYSKPAFASVDDALNDTTPDVVAICVPTNLHYHVMLDVLAASCVKAVLCEKPISYSLKDASQMVDLAAHAGVKLYTNYMRRCDPGVVEVKNRLTKGIISGPVKGVCWYSKGLYNNGSHFLDLLQFWLGDILDFSLFQPGRPWGTWDYEPDFQVQFEQGHVFFHSAREENFSNCTVELLASNGRLRYESGVISWQNTINDFRNPGHPVLSQNPEHIYCDSLRSQWYVANSIFRDLNGRSTTICTGSQGLATIFTIDQIIQQL